MTEFDSYEAALAEIQAELVAVSLEYAGSVASDIYLYGSTADDAMFFDPFYVVDGQVIRKHRLPGVDVSPAQQKALVNYGNQQVYRLFLAAREFGQRPPTQLKLHYVVASHSLDAHFDYGPSPEESPGEIRDAWQREVQVQLDQSAV